MPTLEISTAPTPTAPTPTALTPPPTGTTPRPRPVLENAMPFPLTRVKATARPPREAEMRPILLPTLLPRRAPRPWKIKASLLLLLVLAGGFGVASSLHAATLMTTIDRVAAVVLAERER